MVRKDWRLNQTNEACLHGTSVADTAGTKTLGATCCRSGKHAASWTLMFSSTPAPRMAPPTVQRYVLAPSQAGKCGLQPADHTCLRRTGRNDVPAFSPPEHQHLSQAWHCLMFAAVLLQCSHDHHMHSLRATQLQRSRFSCADAMPCYLRHVFLKQIIIVMITLTNTCCRCGSGDPCV